MQGVHPLLDPDGNPFRDGTFAASVAGQPICEGRFRGCIWAMPMDAEWACNELGTEHFNGVSCCPWCPADRDRFNVRDCSKAACWKPFVYVPGHARIVSAHPIWQRGLGTSRFTYIGDWMHSGDGGVLLLLHASVFKDLLSPGEPFGDGSAAGNRGKLWEALQQGYIDADERKRLYNLPLEMIGGLESGTYPKLKAKCNESKCLVKPMLLMLIKFDDGSDRAAHRIQCYQRLHRMNVIMAEGGLFLTEEAAADLLSSCEAFMQHYSWLAVKSMEAGLLRYNVTPKLHYLWHIAYFGRFQNPKAVWCYGFEDFVGRIQRVCRSCTCGTAMHKVPAKVFRNYASGLSRVLCKRT